MSALASYRALFSHVSTSYVIATLIARLPLAMSQLGVLLLVTDLTGSYGAGGLCAGAIAVANAIGSPMWGVAADRLGQRPVLTTQAIGGGLGFGLVLAVAHLDVAWGWIAVACVVAGFMLPQIGPMSRARWRPLLTRTDGDGPRTERLVSTAFSFEGAADEAAFVLGPALVGVGAFINPSAALALGGVLLIIFGLWFALSPTAVPAQPKPEHHAGAGRLLNNAVLLLCASQLTIGIVFGSVQTGTSVLAKEAGNAGLTGYMHALLGVGSVIAGLLMPMLSTRFTLPSRLRWFALALFVLSLPLLVVHSLALLVPVLLVLGVCIAPYMITTFSLAEQITPVWRLGTVMTLLAAATVLGYSVGAGVAGQLADLGGETPAYAVTVAAGAIALVIGLSASRVLHRSSSVAITN